MNLQKRKLIKYNYQLISILEYTILLGNEKIAGLFIMAVWYERLPSCFVIHVDETGLTDDLVDPVRQVITIAFLNNQYNLIFDLSSSVLIDSFFIGLIISTYREVKKLGGTMICGGVKGQVSEAFHIIRLNRLVELCETVEESIAKMKEIISSASPNSDNSDGFGF